MHRLRAELVRTYHDHQRRGALQLRQGDHQGDDRAAFMWLTEPHEPRAGAKATLFYNRKATALHWLQVNDDQVCARCTPAPPRMG